MGRSAEQEEYDLSSSEEEEDQLQDDDDPSVFKIRNLIPGPDASFKTMGELNRAFQGHTVSFPELPY